MIYTFDRNVCRSLLFSHFSYLLFRSHLREATVIAFCLKYDLQQKSFLKRLWQIIFVKIISFSLSHTFFIIFLSKITIKILVKNKIKIKNLQTKQKYLKVLFQSMNFQEQTLVISSLRHITQRTVIKLSRNVNKSLCYNDLCSIIVIQYILKITNI